MKPRVKEYLQVFTKFCDSLSNLFMFIKIINNQHRILKNKEKNKSSQNSIN